MLSQRGTQYMDPQVMLKIREMRRNLKEGEIVTAKYVAGSSTVFITGKLGKSLSAPYVFGVDGVPFTILPTVAMPSGYSYSFASLDVATPAQKKEYSENAKS